MAPKDRNDRHQSRTTLGDLFTELRPPQESGDAGAAPSDHALISSFGEGDVIGSVYYCGQKNQALSKAGKPYLNVKAVDRTGDIIVRVFDDAERIGQGFSEGDFIYIQGRVQVYQGNMQVIARNIQRVDPGTVNANDYMPTSHMNIDKMWMSLRGIMESLEDQPLRELCLSLFDDQDLTERFKRSPAAMSMHHYYIGGLLEHTLSMTMLADQVAHHYTNINRSMLLAGCLFHDIGKIYELSASVAIDYTDSGKLLGHISMGVMLIEKLCAAIPDFPQETKRLLQHIVLSHHGTREYGSPVIPATVESMIIHHLDNLDAKTNAFLNYAEKSTSDGDWTDRHFLLGTQVRKTVDGDENLYDFRLPENKDKDR